MKFGRCTYQWMIMVIVVIIFTRCSADSMSESKEEPNAASAQVNEGAAEYEEDALESTEAGAKKEASISLDKWNEKAQQQLEYLKDLLVILKDTTLDPAFKIEVKKEVGLLYPAHDSVLHRLVESKLEFNDFKELEIDSGDTLILQFKNLNENVRAKFVVQLEEKDFGNTSEWVEQLKLVSIKVE